MNINKQYHLLLNEIINNGVLKDSSREGMPKTLSIFGHQLRVDLSNGFPIINTKKVSFKNIVVELLWFLRGDDNIKYLIDNKCNIWNEDAYNYYVNQCKITNQNPVSYKDFVEILKRESNLKSISKIHFNNNYVFGDTGMQYPKLWRKWPKSIFKKEGYENVFSHIKYVDQIQNLITGLIESPFSRRHKIQSFNPATINDCALPPCHTDVTFNVRPIPYHKRGAFINYKDSADRDNYQDFLDDLNVPKYYLDCHFKMRSTDVILGLPYNISSYALLNHMLSSICNMIPGDLVVSLDDAHIYKNHLDAAKEQLQRDPNKYKYPVNLTIGEYNLFLFRSIREGYDINDPIKELDYTGFTLENYESYPKLDNPTPLSTGMI